MKGIKYGLKHNDSIFHLIERSLSLSPPGFFDLDNRYESISKLGEEKRA